MSENIFYAMKRIMAFVRGDTTEIKMVDLVLVDKWLEEIEGRVTCQNQ